MESPYVEMDFQPDYMDNWLIAEARMILALHRKSQGISLVGADVRPTKTGPHPKFRVATFVVRDYLMKVSSRMRT